MVVRVGDRAMVSSDARVPVLAFLEIDSALSGATDADLSSAASVFAEFEAHNIAPILCTGGTSRELGYFARRLEIRHPLVAEDGSGLFIPRGYFGAAVRGARVESMWEVIEFGRTRQRVIDVIAGVAGHLDIAVDMLSHTHARQACQRFGIGSAAGRRVTRRLYGEIIRVRGASEFVTARLRRALRAAHMRCTSRGPHLYVVPDQGGTVTVACLRDLYQQHCDHVIALTMVDPHAAAITVPACDVVAAVKPDSLSGIAHLTFQMATESRRLFAGPMSGRPDRVQ